MEVGAKQDFARLVGQSFHLIHIDIRQSIADFHHDIPLSVGELGRNVGGDDPRFGDSRKFRIKNDYALSTNKIVIMIAKKLRVRA